MPHEGGQPVAYASRCMTETEVNYAQIEKELLAILLRVERFEQCVYGRRVEIETDHIINLWRVFSRKAYSAPLSVFRG